jgi:hypothetical protein
MAVLASRSRLIYFRVTEEELDRFRTLAESKGARSLSELARQALEGLQRTEPEREEFLPALLEQITEVRERLKDMSGRLEEINLKLAEQKVGEERERVEETA